MGIKEVAAYLKINQATAYHWAQAGRLPGIKIGRIWRFRREDIDAWLDENMRKPLPLSGAPESEDSSSRPKPQSDTTPNPGMR
jgi:excisionase family DNA binding protein